jgi:hypothetical protein
MAGAASQTDVLSRVRREQRLRGKASDFSGLRIIVSATAITIAILLFAFGAIGMLMLARSPQEPIVSKLDTAPPVPQMQPDSQVELDVKSVKTQRIVSPAPVAVEPPQEKQETVVQQPPAPEPAPETTGTVQNPPAKTEQQVPPQPVQRYHAPQQQQVRRQVPDSQKDNPLFQLFGIRQYR